jgi:biopolymer transport protein ExbD
MPVAHSAVRAEPNVTPMIDVMLVLLIIFMAVGPLIEAGFKATPPTGMVLAAHPDAETDAVIGLDVHGRLFYNKQPIDSASLRARLAKRFAAAPGDRLVYVRADQAIPYEQAESIMELASSSGARTVALVAAEVHDPHP